MGPLESPFSPSPYVPGFVPSLSSSFGMSPFITGSLVNAGTNVLGNLFNWISNGAANRENERLMDKQNEWALRMWRLQNDYNSPAAQMARLRAAGINPSMAFSNGAENTVSGPSETADAPTMRPGMVTPFQMDVSAMANVEVARAQAELYRAEAADLLGNTPEAKARIHERSKNAARMQQEILNDIQAISESKAKIALMNEQELREKAERFNIRFRQTMESKQWFEMKKKIQAEVRKIDKDIEFEDRQLKEMVETYVYRVAGLKLNNQLTEKQMAHYDALIKDLGIDYDLKQQELIINYPAEAAGQSVRDMYSGEQGLVGDIGTTLYDGISIFLSLVKGLISLRM